MNRADFQTLAAVRIAEAKTLLDAGQYDGAYYLAGYAVECALKACIAKLTNLYDFPPSRKIVDDCYTHDLEKLLQAAGLKAQQIANATANRTLGRYWQVVKDWTEQSRYERHLPVDARKLYDAITDPANGVLPWIQARW